MAGERAVAEVVVAAEVVVVAGEAVAAEVVVVAVN